MNFTTANDTAWLHLRRGASELIAEGWPLTQPLTIGRESADITIALPGLSRRHALVERAGINYQITDLTSKNGTAVNGRMMGPKPQELSNGDIIVLAGCLEFCFNDPQATKLTPHLGKLDGLWIDPLTKNVWIDAQQLNQPLSPNQYRLLQLIAEAHGSILSKEDIMHGIWPGRDPGTISNDAVDSLIKRLRRRLAPLETLGPVLEVIRGHGVRLREGR